MSTYIELVNAAMAEAKVTLDPLTPANFSNPPRTVLYSRFKDWVARAYRELLMRRKEWMFRVERGVVDIYPRLHLSYVAVTPSVGDIIRGQSSGIQARVLSVHNHEDIEDDGITEVTLALEMLDAGQITSFITRELIDVIAPASVLGMAVVKGIGSYDLSDEVSNLQSVDEHSIQLVLPLTAVGATATSLKAVPWNSWNAFVREELHVTGQPEYVSVTPAGSLQFYPYVNEAYTIRFNFTKKYKDLVAYDDVPYEIPTEYHDYLMWKALADYADYDSNQRVYARANKNMENYLYYLERDYMEDPYFGSNRFYK